MEGVLGVFHLAFPWHSTNIREIARVLKKISEWGGTGAEFKIAHNTSLISWRIFKKMVWSERKHKSKPYVW